MGDWVSLQTYNSKIVRFDRKWLEKQIAPLSIEEFLSEYTYDDVELLSFIYTSYANKILYVKLANEEEKAKGWTFSYDMLMGIQNELTDEAYELDTVPGLTLIESILIALKNINSKQEISL